MILWSGVPGSIPCLIACDFEVCILDGLLPVDKPKGITSHDVVDRVRRICGLKKVGHTGTLDPMATGVLVLCLGTATRLSRFLVGHDKCYRAQIHLGVTTDTLDAEGQETGCSEQVPETIDQILPHLQHFIGEIEQIPPMYSARKIGGTRLYQMARKGQEVERKAQKVFMHRLEALSYIPPLLTLDMTCSSGTYVRTLADDLGQSLGCGGHLSGLRRTSLGPVSLASCISLDCLASMDADRLQGMVIEPNVALKSMPSRHLNGEEQVRFQHGNPIPVLNMPFQEQAFVRALDVHGRLLGIAKWDGQVALLRPVCVFPNQEG
ncbi:MAG: tRNA pseudouridine(55) synthase TruB [bacterium]|nr:tRNA pseudouridine(55) synthase TruB [bacterium]